MEAVEGMANQSARWTHDGIVSREEEEKLERGPRVMVFGVVTGFGPGWAMAISTGEGEGGYFDKERFFPTVKAAMAALQAKYPAVTLRLHADFSGVHAVAAAATGVSLGDRNLGNGGTRDGAPIPAARLQPIDATGNWIGVPIASGVSVDGDALGLRGLCERLHVATGGAASYTSFGNWNRWECRENLETCHFDYVQQPTLLQHELTALCLVLYVPKFHCELAPIERVWALLKRLAQQLWGIAGTAGSVVSRAAATLEHAWTRIPAAYVAASFRNAYRYAQLYWLGLSAASALVLVRIITGHGPTRVKTLQHRIMSALHLVGASDVVVPIGPLTSAAAAAAAAVVSPPARAPSSALECARDAFKSTPPPHLPSCEMLVLLRSHRVDLDLLLSSRAGQFPAAETSPCLVCGKDARGAQALTYCTWCNSAHHRRCLVPSPRYVLPTSFCARRAPPSASGPSSPTWARDWRACPTC